MRGAVVARVVLTLTCTAATTSCGGAETTTREDGASVIDEDVVSLDAPIWQPGLGWRVEESPAVSIGPDAGDGPYLLHRVGGAVLLPGGGIAVTDGGSAEVRLFDADGGFSRSVGRRGEGPGEFGAYSDMLIWKDSADRLLIAGTFGRVEAFDTQGEFLTSTTLEREPGVPFVSLRGVFNDGSLLVGTTLPRPGERERPGQKISREAIYWRYEDSHPIRELLRHEARGQYVHAYQGGTNTFFIPFDHDPLVVAAGDRLYVVPEAQPLVEVRDLSGRIMTRLRVEGPTMRRVDEIWPRAREEILKGPMPGQTDDFREVFRRIYTDYLAQDLPLPEFVPAYERALADSDGNLWLERRRLSWESSPPQWDVLDPTGLWLGTVTLPTGLVLHDVSGRLVVGVHTDELDNETVRVHRLLK